MFDKEFEISGTFDIEAHDWSIFAVGALYDGVKATIFYDGRKMLDEMRRRGGTWFGHAMGVYDGLYFLEHARSRGIPCSIDRSQHRVSRIVMGDLVMRDSYGLWPVPLDDLAGALRRPVPKLPWRCTCGKKCKGYCRIGEKAKEGDPDLETYCVDDCKVLYDGLKLLHGFTAKHGIPLQGTLGQTAWKAAQSELGVPDSTIGWSLWRHARRADRGGRAHVIRPFSMGPGSPHDICNAYPAQLAHAELPVGNVRELGGKKAMRALAKAKPGLYTCTVTVPDSLFLPPLPWMHAGVMSFPTGTFQGTWTLPELCAALERGVSLGAVHSALVWDATARIFQPLVERWYAIRRDVGRKTPLGQWIGRLSKALTGKFAERPERSRVLMHTDNIVVCLRKGRCAGRDGCTLRCGAYEQLDLDGNIWCVPFSHLGASSYPQWSSYLRAMTRVQLLEQAERFGEDLCMMNTDSLWTIGRAKPEPLGDDLGQWDFQHLWCELDARSVTTYSYRELASEPVLDARASKRVGHAVYKYKRGKLHLMGIPGITADDWKRGRGILDRGIVTFGAAAGGTRGLFSKRLRRWTLPKADRVMYGDRKLHSNGVTYPLDVADLRALHAAKESKGTKDVHAQRVARMAESEIDDDVPLKIGEKPRDEDD